jgi:hypothetical protein
MDFGCVCTYKKVYNLEALTPESEYPTIYPGETYKYYAQPETEGYPEKEA